MTTEEKDARITQLERELAEARAALALEQARFEWILEWADADFFISLPEWPQQARQAIDAAMQQGNKGGGR